MSDCNKPKTNGCGCPPPVIIPGEINGPAGPAGAQGATGNSGTNGIDGTNGTDGISAYDVAVANGFVGTEAAWLLSLEGTNGTDGIDGTDGAQGVPGPTGPASIIWEASNVGLNLVTGILIPTGNTASGAVTTLNTVIDYTIPTPDIAFINFQIEMEFVCTAGDAARINIDLSPYVNLFPISQTAWGISTSIWRKNYSSGAAIQTNSSLDGNGLLASTIFNLPVTELTPQAYWVAGQITVRLN